MGKTAAVVLTLTVQHAEADLFGRQHGKWEQIQHVKYNAAELHYVKQGHNVLVS